MTAFESMSEKLSKTGLYRTDEGLLVYAELMAYAEGLDIYYNALDELLNECFVSTASSYGLELREQYIRKCNNDESLEGRRKSIIAALSICSEDFTDDSFSKYLDVFNVSGSLSTVPLKNSATVYLDSVDESKLEKIQSQITEFLPPYFQVEFESTE